LNPAFHTIINEIMKINDFVVDMIPVQPEIPRRKELMTLVKKKYDIATQIYDSSYMATLPKWAIDKFIYRYKQLEQMYREACAFEVRGESHPECCNVFWIGPSGSGKSRSIEKFQELIAFAEGIVYNPAMLYTVGDDGFHEGYCQQFLCMIEELGLQTSIEDRARVASFIVGVTGTNAYNMKMAFNTKGSVYWNTQYMTISSNLCDRGWKPYHHGKKETEMNGLELGLTSNAAFERRMHIVVYRCDPTEEDPLLNVFILKQCIFFPELVGKKLYVRDIVTLAKKCHDLQRARFKASRMTLEQMARELPEFAHLHGFPTDEDSDLGSVQLDVPIEESDLIPDHVSTGSEDFELGNPGSDLSQLAADDIAINRQVHKINSLYEATGPPTLSDRRQAMEESVLIKNLADPPDTVSYIGRVARLFFNYDDKTKLEREKLEADIQTYMTYAFILAGITTVGGLYLLFSGFFEKPHDPMAGNLQATSPEILKRRSGVRARRALKRAVAKGRVHTPGYKATAPAPDSDDDVPIDMLDQILKIDPDYNRYEATSSAGNYALGLLKTIGKGTVTLTVGGLDENGIRSSETCTAFHLKDGWFVSVAHLMMRYYHWRDPKVQIKFDKFDHILPMPKFVQSGDEDICFFQLKGINLPPALYSYLPLESKLRPIPDVTPMKVVCRTADLQVNIKSATKGEAENEAYVDMDTTFLLDFPMFYYCHIDLGDSGSPVCIMGEQGRPLLVGMQCARSRDLTFGMGMPLSKEAIDDILLPHGFKPSQFEATARSTDIPMVVKEVLPPELAYYPPSRTRIKPSDMFEWNGEATFVPAKLSPFNIDGVVHDPLFKAMGKLNQVDKDFPPIPEDIFEILHHIYPKTSFRELLTFQQCLEGLSEQDIKSMCMNTSSGYPWSLKKHKGKSPMVFYDGTKHHISSEFLQFLNDQEQLLKSGQNIVVRWQDLLKDETRPKAKVEAGKTRLFSACPIHYLFLMKRYFGAFVAAIQAGHSVKPVSIGINVHSLEWTRLVKILSKFSGSIVAGDFENYDGTIPIVLGKAFLRFVNEWYHDGPDNAKIRELLMQHLFYAEHVCFDKIFQTIGSHPSGDPITGIYNSIINTIIMTVVAIYDLGLSFEEFVQFNYGDDNIFKSNRLDLKVSDFAPHIKRRFGMVYTHCSKSDVDQYDTLDTITFLGRKFRLDCGVYRAPLDIPTIVESTYWCTRGGDHDVTLLSASESFFLEFSHHPKEVFDHYTNIYLLAVQDRRPDLYPAIKRSRKPYSSYRRKFYEAGNSFEPTAGPHTQMTIETFSKADNNRENQRASVEVPDSFVQPLGVDQDLGEILVNNAGPPRGQPYVSSNIPTYKQDDIFEREQLIGQVTWSTSSGVGVNINTQHYPFDLFTLPYVANKLAFWRYIRADLELTFRVVSQQQLAGKLLISAIPLHQWGAMDTAGLQTNNQYYTTPGVPALTWHSGLEHILVSASSNQTHKWTLPFVHFKRFLDLSDYKNSEMYHLTWWVAIPLVAADGSVQSVTVVSTAKLVNVQLAMPADSGNFLPNPLARSMKALLKRTEDNEEVLEHELSDIKRKQNRVAGFKYEATAGRESEAKLFSASSIHAISDTIKAGVESKAFKAASMGLRIAALCLDKPRTSNTTAVFATNKLYHNCHSNGVQNAPLMGFDNDNRVAVTTEVGGRGIDEMNLLNFAMTPVLTSVITIVNNLGLVDLLSYFDLETNQNQWGYVDWARNWCVAYSGGIKYRLYFEATLFQNVEIIIFLANSSTANPFDGWHKKVQITGACDVAFTVPFPYPYVAMPKKQTDDTFQLYVQVLSWSQSSTTASTPITCLVYKAAASDMKFFGYRNVTWTATCTSKWEATATTTTGNPRLDFREDFESIVPGAVGYDHQGFIFGEELRSIRDIVHAWLPIQPLSFDNLGFDILTWYTGPTTPFNGPEVFNPFFRFWRGSVGFQIEQYNPAAKSVFGMNLCLGSQYPGNTDFLANYTTVDISTPTNGTMVPFFRPCFFEMTMNRPIYPNCVTYACSATSPSCYLFKTFGDDFSYMSMTLPMPGTISYNGGRNTYQNTIRSLS